MACSPTYQEILVLESHFVRPYLDIQMDPELSPAEPLGAVAVQTDHVLPGHVGREGELPLAAVNLE